MRKLHVLDLFSGIGGFSLGLERTGGFETVAFCEIEEFPRRVLAKHWPEVPCYDDVRTLTAARLAADGITGIDVITGGFPCQDLSVAGKRAGLAGERSGLWSEIVRLTRELQPRYVIVENVANLLRGPSEKRGGWFGRVLGDLAECGYNAEWENIPAAALGAPHLRQRIWVIAAHSGEERIQRLKPQTVSRVSAFSWCKDVRRAADLRDRPDLPDPLFRGTCDGVPDWMDRVGACGNAVVPQIPEMIGRAILEAEAQS